MSVLIIKKKKNDIEVYESYALLVLRNKYGAITGKSIIDLDDIDVVKQYKWSLGNHGYVTSGCGKKQILLHRLLSNAPSDLYVDHINRNKLDNRKLNYRFCTNQENNRNKDLYSHNSSGITGVTWDKERNKWQSQIVVDNKNISLGRFDLFDDAVNARLMAEEKYFKDFMPENRNGLYKDINAGNFTNPTSGVNSACGETNRLIVLGNTVPSGHTAGRVFDMNGISPTVMERHSKVNTSLPAVLKYQRTEYAKKIRKDYEAGKIKERRCNMRKYTLRLDGLCNTITTVQKDNYIVVGTAMCVSYNSNSNVD